MLSKKPTGFTIVELLIVIVVIGILAAITIVAFSGVQQRARDTQRKQQLSDVAKALEIYRIDISDYITTGGGAGNGQGWFNGGAPTILKTLQNNGQLVGSKIQDPKCLTNEVAGCSGYLKIDCGPDKSFILAKLESLPSGQPLPAALAGCSNTNWWTTYQTNYYMQVGS